jgi:hypothetical protein
MEKDGNIKTFKIYQIYPKRAGHAFVGGMVESWFDNAKIVEIENTSPKFFANKYKNKEIIIILQLRSFKNWIASYAKSNSIGKTRRIINKNVNWWYNVAKEFYEETNYLKEYNKVIKIYYDTFFQNKEYRKIVCEALGGTYNENMLNVVTNKGGGSSFDGLSYNGKAQQMNVLKRYEDYNNLIIGVLNDNPTLNTFCKRYNEV